MSEIPRTSTDATEEQQDRIERTTPSETNARAVWVLCGAASTYFCTVGLMNAFGVFQEYYHREMLRDKTDFDIAWIGSFATFSIFALGAPAGILADRVGPTLPMIFGAISTLTAVFMVSLCTEYYQFFLAQGLLLGTGLAFLAIPATTTIPKHFRRNRGLATGISVAGSSLGGVVWPIMFDQLLNHRGVSFGWTMRIVGFTMIPLLAIACFTVRLPPQQVPAGPSPTAANSEKSDGKRDRASIAKDPTFLFLCAGLAIGYFGFFTPFFFVSTYAVELSMPTSFAFYLVSMLNGASLVGRILPGYLADRYGHFNVLTLALTTSGVTALCWTAAESTAGLIVWVPAYGFSSGAIMSSQLACATDLSTEAMHGAALGMVMGAVSLTGLFGAPISGQLVPHGYLALSMYSGATLLVAAGLLLLARLRLSRKLWARV